MRFLYVRAVTSDVSSHLAGTLESREWRIVASALPRERTRVRVHSTRLRAARLNPSSESFPLAQRERRRGSRAINYTTPRKVTSSLLLQSATSRCAVRFFLRKTIIKIYENN